MKNSNREVIKTIVQFLAGAAAAVPVFLATSGLSGDVGAGATALAVAAAVTKFMNLALDELE